MSYQPTADDLQVILRTMKRAHLAAGPADAALRKDRLRRATRLIRENHAAISAAISADFGNRSVYQSMIADMATTVKMLEDSAAHVEQWMKPEMVESPGPGMQAWIEQQPLGVVGIISPWNFPINLAFGPLAGVFAAGNTAMLKPSELTPKISELLAELIAGYFDPVELTVILGDASVGAAFSGLPFDHLVFTGSTSVGRHVMRAAADNLVPVTLELGGKSPVVVAEDFDMRTAVERTLTIKTFNAGQICLSPDYMMVTEDQREQLVMFSKEFITESFATLITNPEYTSIISERHFTRLVGLLTDAEQKGATLINLAPGSEPAFDETARKIAPHLVLDVTDDMAIMQEEIFGPLLPVKTYRSADEVIAYINANPRPLAAYYFGDNAQLQDQFMRETTSGGLVINDVMTHASIDSLPFGGVGASGIGAYHGVHGFRRFTHAKPVVVQSQDGASNLRLRAPYADKARALEAFFNS
ncbi:MAG: coniferyl aldehyde dehydrogenase [Pseudomonas sp.]|uniref:coniferyl aldehyde dehydrogenase n=1 Tax=Pseudomonas sp. TaxID=306 RepID=UPI003D6FABD3